MLAVPFRRAWQFTSTVLGIILRHPMTMTSIIPVLADGTIVLVRRQDTGLWTLPGGLIQWAESVPSAAKRVLVNTIGLELVSIRNLLGIYSLRGKLKGHCICFTLEVEAKGNIKLNDLVEFSESKAFKPEDLPSLEEVTENCRSQLEDYLKYSEQTKVNTVYRFGNSSIRRKRHLLITWLGIIFRYPIAGTTIIPVLPDGKIVLVKRPTKKDQEEEWGFPGGMVDWGEDIGATVSRELKEETGLDLVKINRILGVYSEAFRDPRIHSIAVSVEVKAEGKLDVFDTLEIEEARALTVEELRCKLKDKDFKLIHDHARQLQDYFQGLTTIA